MRDENSYYPYFDYLRAVAAIGVFVSHADADHYFPSNLGNACVQLFFALSGFLIGRILLRSKIGDMPRFYFNRATRIWLPYILAIGLLASVTAIKQGFHEPKFRECFFYMVTFVYNWFGPPQLAAFVHKMPLDGTGNHFWSICVEEQFYLVAPFAILLLPRKGLFACLAAASFVSPGYFASISLGVVLDFLGPMLPIIAFAAIVGAVGVALRSYVIAAQFLSVAIIGLLARPGSQTITGRIAGGASYSFYLNHWLGLFAINAFMKLGMSRTPAEFIGLGFAAAISVAHYFFIDRKIVLYRDRFFTDRRGVAMCIIGFALVGAGLVGAHLYGIA